MAATMQTTGKQSGNGKMPMETATDLFVHELSDMRSAEGIIATMLEAGIPAASDAKLKKGLEAHLEQTRGHLETIETIISELKVKPHDVECEGAKGLKKELDHAVKAKPSSEVLDMLIAGGAAKTENYEICGYTGLIDLAKMLGHKNAEKLLSQNLKEEEETLVKVEKLESTLQEKLEAKMKK